MGQFKLKDLLNFLPIAVAIAEDPECKKITVNKQMVVTIGGYYSSSIEEYASFLSNPLFKVFHDRRELTVNDLPLRRAVLDGEVVDGYSIDIVRPNGIVSTVIAYAAPWRTKGKITGGVAAYLDTTDLRKARAEIQLLKDQLQDLVLTEEVAPEL